MRVVIKPFGFVVMLLSIGVLAWMACKQGSPTQSSAVPVVPTVVGANPSAIPSPALVTEVSNLSTNGGFVSIAVSSLSKNLTTKKMTG